MQLPQRAGTGLLVTLLEVFGNARGPDAPSNKNLLQHFTLQIALGVRHGVNVAPQDETTIRSFVHACKALQLVVEKWLIIDLAVLRYLVRPLMLPGAENCKAGGHGRRAMHRQRNWSALHARDAWRVGTTTC